MSEQQDNALSDAKQIELKRKRLSEELARLTPELIAEIEVRKALIIDALIQLRELPKESQPLHQAINLKSARVSWPYWFALFLCVVSWISDGISYTNYFSWNFVFVVLGITSIYHIGLKFDLLEMRNRFDQLSNRIKQAELTLSVYGGASISSFGEWQKIRDIVLEKESFDTASYLVGIKFANELEESILVKMKLLDSTQFTLEDLGLIDNAANVC